MFGALPYEVRRVVLDCGHSPFYILRNYENQPLFCGLCFFREGFAAELPGRIHEFKVLAENGNPQTSDRFMAHLFLVMGLRPPPRDENLKEFRRKRERPRVREQYTEAAWGSFPVASALWKLMGHQPPLGQVLVLGVGGQNEIAIAKQLEASQLNICIRMAKAVRTAMKYLPRN